MSKLGKKTLSMGMLLGGLLVMAGCARPGEIGSSMVYTPGERYQMWTRNMDLEGKMTQDDIDSMLLIRPVSQLSWWRIH